MISILLRQCSVIIIMRTQPLSIKFCVAWLNLPPPPPNTIRVKNLVGPECDNPSIGCTLLLDNYEVKMIDITNKLHICLDMKLDIILGFFCSLTFLTFLFLFGLT